ncbi:MAG: efflux RND transporter permease subunit [Pseudomonadota bacterium]
MNAPDARGVIAWFAQNSVAANLLMATLLVGGMLVLGNINTEVLPQVDPRIITVTVSYPGATPEEVEDGITRRVEDAVLGLEGVDRVSSAASEGVGTVTMELNDFIDAQSVKDSAQSAVDRISDFPPEDANEPEITIAKATSSVMRLVVVGDVSERVLKQAGETIVRELLAQDGVSIVTLQGARDYEISIETSQDTLRQYGIGIDQVAAAIRTSSINLSAGSVRTSGGDVLLRTNTEARDADAFAEIIVLSDSAGQRVRLGDIATINDGFAEDRLINHYDGQPAVFLQIDRSSDEDAFDVRDNVLAFLESYRPAPGVSVLVASDTTTIVSDRINLLVRNAIMGLALVFVFLALTLDLRLAFWTSVGIPVAFLGGAVLFGQFTTISMTTLLGLIMVLGIVVDDAIVVGENIHEQQTKFGSGSLTAIQGARTVLMPVVIGVTTSMLAFGTLLLSTGVLGQILRPVPIVVLCVLLVSLIEVFLILPAHLAHGREWSVGAMQKLKRSVQSGIDWVKDRAITPLVRRCVRFPYVVMATGAAVLIASAGLLTGGHVRFIFFPTVEGDEITMVLEMPAGAPFEATEAAMNRITDAAYEAIGGKDSALYQSLSVTIGGQLSSGFNASGTTLQSELGVATLELSAADQRSLTSAEIERLWRDAVGVIPGIESLSFESSGLAAGGADVSFDFTHPDNATLTEAVEQMIDRMANIEGVSEIENSAKPGKRQIEFALTPAGTAAGLSVDDLARSIRQSYFGEEVQRFQRGREEVKVFVRFPQNERRSLADLARLRIPIPGGDDVALTAVASIKETRSFVSIDRVDGQRIVTVSADVDEATATPTDVNSFIEREILPPLLEAHPGLRIKIEGQARSQGEELASLSENFLLAILGIYVLLASVLRSYFQPLIILMIIPFGLVGAILGHMLFGYDLTFLSLFGVVALSGVIINDSIVLIDYFNLLQRQGGDPVNNIVEAVRRRFRPILLTTLTTVIGLLPMIAETSIQAQFLIPMALSLAFGILVASMLILFLVPAALVLGLPKQAAGARAPSDMAATSH